MFHKTAVENRAPKPYNNPMPGDLYEKKFSIIQEIANAIAITENINSIANLMLDLAISYCNASKGSLMTVNDRQELTILTAVGIDVQFISTYKIKVGEGIAGTVANTLTPVLVEDIEKDERFKRTKRDRYKTQSFISSPVVSKNKLIGVININDKVDGTSFTQDELELLTIIANHAAIALENAYLMTQLRSKAHELDEINKRLIEADVMKTEFLAKISHELRTPLNSVKGAIYYLQQSEMIPDSEKHEFYSIISSDSNKLAGIVDNLIDFLRTEDESKILKKNIINVADIMRDVMASKALRTTLYRSNIELALRSDETVSDIVGDKILVTQMFMNFLEGLLHYLTKNDSIAISISENDAVKVTITASKPLPDDAMKYFSENKASFQIESLEERLKLILARNVVEIHRWKLSTINSDIAFEATIQIPKSSREKKEAYINTSMDMFVEFVSEVLDLDICSIMLSNELTHELEIKGARGLDERIIKGTRIKLGDKIAGWVAMEGKPLYIPDIESDERFEKKNIAQYTTKSLLSLPLKVNGKTVGVLNLNNKKNAQSFTEYDYNVASVLSERISAFIKRVNSGLYDEKDFQNFIASFDNLLNAEKRYHKKGILMPSLVMMFMEELGASDDEKKVGLYVSLVYDLGLMLIDDKVMKKEKLSPSEIRTLKVHPYNTLNLLEDVEFSDEVKSAILHHHERYDGKGYPDGLKGDDIPVLSRVLSISDTLCALMSERPYGKQLTKDQAFEEIRKYSGTKYDPKLVDALSRFIDKL